MRTAIEDDELADEVANVAANHTIDIEEERDLVRASVAPASLT